MVAFSCMLTDPTKALLVALVPVGAMGHHTIIGHDVTPWWRNQRLRTGFLADTQRQGIKLDQYFIVAGKCHSAKSARATTTKKIVAHFSSSIPATPVRNKICITSIICE